MANKNSKSYKFPQVRISRAALEHLEKVLPELRKRRGYNLTKTAAVSEAIMAIRVKEPKPCAEDKA